ncbi:8-amino-7-oxononanoate synthase [Conexibacter woesei]|uniref:8-amino-7-ketopelargonate synthase n=1 Tax=Conexibacter woesei (strain DSM 14684 / CCUG 47730 / CIP 108061 / JCM 11494 / NBRC 100937 / ID131577) TaxID=469383 RepID=D3F789_CONWI|nr:8-amino-7-oxononanoate synthase [Conexibacter woesei]ADB48860.1 8-amino-7-oxononanoate synthase [Conexibacter woesei DSM 14684]
MTDVEAALAQIGAAGLLRELRTIEQTAGGRVLLDGRDALLLCSNDYLGLAQHPAVRAAAAAAAEQWGAGAGASRLVSGTLAQHAQLERELAAFKGSEACLLFGSGFLANTGVVAALAGRGGVVLSDALNHASIVDGCRLAAAETVVYAHADLDALAAALARAGDRPATIVTDAIFSMDGDRAPLEGIVALARRHGARVIVDEAHGTGVVGPGGRGLVAELGLTGEVDVVVGTLSKALGSYGAFVCCDARTHAFLVNRARTLIYSTAPPPPSIGAAREALRIVREQPALVERLRSNARALRAELGRQGFAVEPGEMPIVPLVVGDPRAAMELCERALDAGVFAQAIRPPTVPDGTSRLRLVARADHDEADLVAAARTLARLR